MSYSKVRAMTRVATPDNEDFLLHIARHGTAYHVETLVRKYRRVQAQRGADTANAIHVTRELTYYWDEDGSLVLRGCLPAEQRAMVLKALEMQMEKQFQPSSHSHVSAETCRRARTIAWFTRAVSAARRPAPATLPSKTGTQGRYRTDRICRGGTEKRRPSGTCMSASIT